MVKKTVLFMLSSIFCSVPLPSSCQEFKSDMPDMKAMFQKHLNSSETNEMFADAFGVADVNDDGFVSENEFSYIVDSVDYEYNLNATEKAEKKARLKKFFAEADNNHDKRLNKNEYVSFMKNEAEFEAAALMERVQEMMAAFDGSPASVEKMQEKVQENLDSLEKAVEKMKETDSKEMANQLLDGITRNIAAENYFQMDKDKNNCVTEREFVTYMLEYSKEQEKSDPSTKDFTASMTADDWKDVYSQEKKQKADCLTKEEYIKNSVDELAEIGSID